jgi:hypothetical protein
MIIQYTYPESAIDIGDVLKSSSGSCFTYIGNFINYTPPAGFTWSQQEVFTGTSFTIFNSCVSCLAPTPTPTPTVTSWNVKGEFSLNCPVCELTNGGTTQTIYADGQSLVSGVYVYEDINLTTPVFVTYIKYGTKIFEVSPTGLLTEYCNVNGNC